MSAGPGASSSELAQQVRSDFRQARVAVSRALLLHGRGSPEHQQAAEQWALRQAVLYELAVQSNVRPDDIRLSQ
ncbi:hypothetical protein [Streptomyces capitiformicae]|uniref:Uncharacterized protein n=1 Tax=Streptomyces capitiformicae TaxID=2014920 RepID=A0A919GPE3_9ACTN|nr:hypothetical protein [Streptomyces capitiformicae]GHH88307.1 hypothetical protein GCM10017771_33020 [Streptomyces capitiformicae]